MYDSKLYWSQLALKEQLFSPNVIKFGQIQVELIGSESTSISLQKQLPAVWGPLERKQDYVRTRHPDKQAGTATWVMAEQLRANQDTQICNTLAKPLGRVSVTLPQ